MEIDNENLSSAENGSTIADEDYSELADNNKGKFKFDKAAAQQAKSKLETQKVKDTLDRYKFLLGQSELFSHFIKAKGLVGEDDLPVAGKKKAKEQVSKRGRKTEKEEDAELLQEEIKEEVDEASAVIKTETVFSESPSYVTGGKMRDYQVHGLNWMISLFEHGISGILADEMGLGKTLQTISFLGYLKHYRQIPGPHMILVPKSTLQNWINEFHRWVPDFDAFLFHGSKDERAELVKTHLLPQKWEVCVTSYETCMAEKANLRKIAWQYIVIDEAHRIKNENSLLSQIMRTFSCRNRLLITGTPLQNNLRELWALLNFLLPDVFTTYEEFDDYLQGTGEHQDKVVLQLHAVLRPFLLRRLKADVEKSLLPKKKVNLYVNMTQMQRDWYQKILAKDVQAVNGAVKENRDGKTRLLNIVMQLRKCCNHPYLFDGAEPGPPYTTDQHLVDNAGKMVILDKLLSHLKSQGSRVLIFSQMSRMLDILEDYCVWRGYKYCRIDGNTAHEDRIRDIDEYNRPGSEKFIFLLTTRAGGLGINLATADSVVMYDSDWNPQVDLQAEDRAHRIGQKKQVVVFRFVTDNAIEEKVIERAASKLRLDQLVIQQGRAAQNKAMSKNELVNMIRHGADSILQGTGSVFQDETIDDILKKGEERTKKLDQKFQTLGLDDLQKFSLDSGKLYEFEGKDFQKKDAAQIGMDWIGLGRRERKTGGYSIDEYYRQQMYQTSTKTAGEKQPKGPKLLISAADYQFYPARLYELQKREIYAYWKETAHQIPVPETGETEEQAKERALEQERIDNAEPLTEEEKNEVDELKSKGFYNWNKRDFFAFIRGCEKYGRDKLEDISREVENKDADEVAEYADVFWKRCTEISDYESLIEKIERGEEKIRKRNYIQDQLTAIVKQYQFPLHQLYIPYGQNQKGKNFTEEEDRFMVVSLQKNGYNTDDVYDVIRRDIREHPGFRFDWFIKSRTSTEISRRCQTIINLLLKDADLDEDEGRKGKRKGGIANGLATGKRVKSTK